MKTYKAQLKRKLADQGWEVVEAVDSDDWWADEHWTIQSLRNSWGLNLVLTILVDPMWDAPRKKGQGVWLITASASVPLDRLTAAQGIANLMVKGRFDEKLVAFVASLDTYRNDREKATPRMA